MSEPTNDAPPRASASAAPRGLASSDVGPRVRTQKSRGQVEEETSLVMQTIGNILDAAGRDDAAAFERLIGDEVWRRYILDAVERLAPPRTSGVSLQVRRGETVLCSGDSIRRFVERASQQAQHKQGRAAVVGDLKKVDFLTHLMTLRHRGTGRELVCSYEPEVENSLLKHRRELILVFGLVTRDGEGRPQSIDAVDHIEPVDLSDLSLTRISVGDEAIEPQEPLVASVTFNEEDVIYEASIEPLSILTFAETREELRRPFGMRLRLSRSDFLRLVDCPMSQEEYERTVRD